MLVCDGFDRNERAESQKVSLYRISRLKLLVLNNIMSLLDHSWHFANNLTHRSLKRDEGERQEEMKKCLNK